MESIEPSLLRTGTYTGGLKESTRRRSTPERGKARGASAPVLYRRRRHSSSTIKDIIKDSLNQFMEANFPRLRRVEHHKESCPIALPRYVRGLNWRLASQVVRVGRVRWTTNSFDSYMTVGVNGIFSTLLREVQTYRVYIALGYTPMTWRTARAAYIPTVARMSYTKAKDFHHDRIDILSHEEVGGGVG